MVGVCVLRSDGSVAKRYFHTDNLGSIAVITDQSRAVVERDSYDAWGKRRNPLTWQDDTSGGSLPASPTTRGFTGQEELAGVGLVHLNGRVYDPLVGRMMSADPFVPDPLNAQAWNRYSYVINNPLAFTDPNGYCFLGMCSWGKAISTFFGRTFGVLFREVPILGTLFEIGAVGLCTFLSPGNPACAAIAFAATSFVAGVTSGNLGFALRAGLIAGVTAFANIGVGAIAGPNSTVFGTAEYFGNMAGSALVGCASAAASGGKCGAGALSAGVSAGAGPFINSNNFALNVASHAVVGGLAGVAGGGKFGNGAVTGAFAYLFSPQAADKGEGAYGWVDWDPASHQYAYRDYICDTSQFGCSAANVFDGLLRNAYPGQPGGTIVQPQTTYYVTGGNPIHVDIDYDNLSLTNVTEPGHWFCCGTVARGVEQDGSGIFVETVGKGTNSWVGNAMENWLLGNLGFNQSTAGIQSYIYSLGRSAAANSHIFWPRP
jgi:RHS repeat-associated protein